MDFSRYRKRRRVGRSGWSGGRAGPTGAVPSLSGVPGYGCEVRWAKSRDGGICRDTRQVERELGKRQVVARSEKRERGRAMERRGG
jgi:hypothetical protein